MLTPHLPAAAKHRVAIPTHIAAAAKQRHRGRAACAAPPALQRAQAYSRHPTRRRAGRNAASTAAQLLAPRRRMRCETRSADVAARRVEAVKSRRLAADARRLLALHRRGTIEAREYRAGCTAHLRLYVRKCESMPMPSARTQLHDSSAVMKRERSHACHATLTGHQCRRRGPSRGE